MKAALFGSFIVSVIVSIFLWMFFSFRGTLQASELLNWMGVFVTSLSLTFAVYIVVLAIDAYAHLNEIRAAKTDLRSIQDEQRSVQTALKTSEDGIAALKEQIKTLRKRQVEFVLRLNTQVLDTIHLSSRDSSPELRPDLVRALKRESALLIIDSFPDDPNVVMPQIYALLEVGDAAALAKASSWLAHANVPEATQLMQRLTLRKAELDHTQ